MTTTTTTTIVSWLVGKSCKFTRCALLLIIRPSASPCVKLSFFFYCAPRLPPLSITPPPPHRHDDHSGRVLLLCCWPGYLDPMWIVKMAWQTQHRERERRPSCHLMWMDDAYNRASAGHSAPPSSSHKFPHSLQCIPMQVRRAVADGQTHGGSVPAEGRPLNA